MKIFRKIKDLKAFLSEEKFKGKSVGFVPTMGYLHEGHISLLNRSRCENDISVVSIYVNPSQFNDAKDFDLYPRDEKRDLELLKQNNTDVVFLPSVEEITSIPFDKHINLGLLNSVMEGAYRPGHFEGVIEVVYRLFDCVEPNKAYFGEKDFQQLAIIKRMVEELKLPIKIIPCPTEREPSGLAKSSRNSRLSDNGKKQAALIYKNFLEIKDKVLNSQLALNESINGSIQNLTKLGFEVEYLIVASEKDLKEVSVVSPDSRLFVAAKLEGVRLIDNLPLC